MRSRVLLTIAVCLLGGYCSRLNSQQVPILDLAKAIESPGKIVLSDFIGNLTYIPLETNQICLINANPEVKLSKNFNIDKI